MDIIAAAQILETIDDDYSFKQETSWLQCLYKSLSIPQNLACASVTKVIEDDHGTILIVLIRFRNQNPRTKEQRDLLDRLASPIRNAVWLGLHLERHKISLAGGTFDTFAMPVFAVNATSQLITMSKGAADILETRAHIIVRGGILQPRATEKRDGFARAVRHTCRSLPAVQRVSSRFQLGDDAMSLNVEIVPLTAECAGWLHTTCGLVAVRNAAARNARLTDDLARVYGLTPSECAVTMHLVEGRNARAIAAVRNVAEGTVRNQIKAILGKTGHGRQVELVAALRG